MKTISRTVQNSFLQLDVIQLIVLQKVLICSNLEKTTKQTDFGYCFYKQINKWTVLATNFCRKQEVFYNASYCVLFGQDLPSPKSFDLDSLHIVESTFTRDSLYILEALILPLRTLHSCCSLNNSSQQQWIKVVQYIQRHFTLCDIRALHPTMCISFKRKRKHYHQEVVLFPIYNWELL